MNIPSELTAILEKMVNEEVERRMKELSVYVVYDGERVDADVCDISHGEIYIEIESHLYFSETCKTGFIIFEPPATKEVAA